MDIMEVDPHKPSTSTSASVVTDPMEGSSGTNNRPPPVTSKSQTITIKNDLNMPWFV